MNKESLLKDYEEIKDYYQEMNFVQETGVLDFVKKFVELKKKDASIKISKEGKYFIEIIWPKKIEKNKPIFENVVSILPNLNQEKLVILGSSIWELTKNQCLDKKVLKKTLREVFKKPAVRANIDFAELGF